MHIIAGSIPEREGDNLYNTCCIFDNKGELIDTHRKVHLFDIDIPGKITFKESEVLSAGTKGKQLWLTEDNNDFRPFINDYRPFVVEFLFICLSGTVFDVDNVKIGVGICYDIRFPELAWKYRREGAKVLVYPGAFNLTTGAAHWAKLQIARALDNQVKLP